MRVGVFSRPDGFSPVATSWPLGRLTFGAEGVVVSAPSVRRSFKWREVVSADRTRGGVRFKFGDRARTIVVSTLIRSDLARLSDAVRANLTVGAFDESVHRLTWWRWDPDE